MFALLLPLVIALSIAILFFWLAIMLLWWHEDKDSAPATLDSVAMRQIERIIRLTRRSYYASMLYGGHALTWGNKNFSRAFVQLFPKAAPAFQKYDPLAGLEDGPSSYFLHSITPAKGAIGKSRVRRKKIVA